MKALKDMTLEELDQAKYKLEQHMQQLREEKRGLPEDDPEFNREGAVNRINEDLAVLRQRKLDIQEEQDRRLPPLGPASHTISGAGGIESEERVDGIGGQAAKT